MADAETKLPRGFRLYRYRDGYSLERHILFGIYWPLCHCRTVDEAVRRAREHEHDGERVL